MSRHVEHGYYYYDGDGDRYELSNRDYTSYHLRRQNLNSHDLEHPYERSNFPVEDLERLCIGDCSSSDSLRNDQVPQRHVGRHSPLRMPRYTERDEREFAEVGRRRGPYAERHSIRNNESTRRERWPAMPVDYGRDDKGRSKWNTAPFGPDDRQDGSYSQHSRRDDPDENGAAWGDSYGHGFPPPARRSRYRADEGPVPNTRDNARLKLDNRNWRDSYGYPIPIRPPSKFAGRRDGGIIVPREPNSDRSGIDVHSIRLFPRAPSPEPPPVSTRTNNREAQYCNGRRRRHSSDDVFDEWQDTDGSLAFTSSPLHSSREHEAITSRRGMLRHLDDNEDTLVWEWEGPRRRGDTCDRLEEDLYGRPSTGRNSSNNNVAEGWEVIDSTRRRRLGQDGSDASSQRLLVPCQRYDTEEEIRVFSNRRRDHVEELVKDSQVGCRYTRAKGPRDRMWTEVTKGLVLREAIEQAGYEYEETGYFYYIFDYLGYDDVSVLVDLSDDIRRARRKRIHEIQRKQAPSPPLFASGRRSAVSLMTPEKSPGPYYRS